MSNYQFFKRYFFPTLMLLQLCSCLTSGAGSIKSYNYPVSKLTLQKAVEKVITGNSDIHRDTTKNYMIDISNINNDTIWNNYYNDGDRYITLKIDNVKTNTESSEYVLQYSESSHNSDTAKMATISITYAYESNGKGGSKGYGDFPWYKPFLKRRITKLFENKFIDRIDKILQQTHTITN